MGHVECCARFRVSGRAAERRIVDSLEKGVVDVFRRRCRVMMNHMVGVEAKIACVALLAMCSSGDGARGN